MKVAKYFLIILVPPLIILANFQYLIFNFNYYRGIYTKVGVYQSSESRKTVDGATANLLGYFKDKNGLDENFFSTQAILHLEDVKKLLKSTTAFFYLFLFGAFSSGAILIFKRNYKMVLASFLISSLITVGVILVLAIGLFGAFDEFFVRFHQIFFTNELWAFPPDDNLIKLFPSQFFVQFANKLAVNIALTSLTIALIAAVILKKISK